MPSSPVQAPRAEEASRARLLTAFAALYVIWGSTYLAIRVAIDTLPPLLMSGARFVVAGALLYAFMRWRGEPAPTLRHWRSGAVVGATLLLLGNGGVAWAEQTVPSGLAALLVAIVPGWMVLFDWMARGIRPRPPVFAGLLLGFAGVAVLVGPEDLLGGGSVDPAGAAAIFLGTIAWAFGSIYSRSAPLPRSPLMSTAVQMLVGGVWLGLAGGLLGEAADFEFGALTTASVLAWVYLVLIGAIVGFSAYIYLLRHTDAAKASTYAYVNPVIAVLLGWLLAGEPMNERVLLAVLVIVPAVALIVSFRQRK